MGEIIRMPRLSDTMEEGNIVSWLKKEGDQVKVGEVIAEVETDKATMELESFFDGYLIYIGVKSGPVPVDGVIAIIGKKDEDFKAILAESASPAATTLNTGKDVAHQLPSEAPAVAQAIQPIVPEQKVVTETLAASDSRVKASPLAKNIAAQSGVPLQGLHGSGENGRIIKKDVENYISHKPDASVGQISQMPVLSDFEYGNVSVNQMRKTIAKRLGESKFSAPHFYLTVEVNMDNAVASRKAINEISPVKISFNDLVIKASAATLRKHPRINSSWMGDFITYHKDINIGVAVAVEDGLVVPVLNHADLKSLSMINQEVKDLAGKAKAKKLSLQEMQGNTFTISNLGMFDIEEFTAIINPPDACILAVGSIIKKPIVKDDQIVIGNMMKITLSCDHRVVDGATGAQFLQTLKSMLENPVLILV